MPKKAENTDKLTPAIIIKVSLTIKCSLLSNPFEMFDFFVSQLIEMYEYIIIDPFHCHLKVKICINDDMLLQHFQSPFDFISISYKDRAKKEASNKL
jgi:hypothetical protein